MLPALVIGCGYTGIHYFHQFQHAGSRRLLALFFSLLLFYVWVLIGVIRRRQDTLFSMLVQASFYVFVFSVLTLTGYFIFFNQVSAHGWWLRIIERIDTRDGVNLKPFLFLKGRNILSYEVVGNFIMLFPLGIYLPLLYSRIKNFFTVTLTAMLVSLSIELMQLATNFRIADIDDVILNTAGASAGFVVYLLIHALLVKPFLISKQPPVYN